MTKKTMRPSQASVLGLWDDTLDVLREHGRDFLPRYLAMSLPFAVACLFFIDILTRKDTASLAMSCCFLVASGWLRWLGGGEVQRQVAFRCFGREPNAWKKMFVPFFWLRLLMQPFLAGPIALDPLASGSPWASAMRLWRSNAAFFLRYRAVSFLFLLLGVTQLLVMKYFLVEMLFPYVLGFDSQVFRTVMDSRFWMLSVLVLLFLAYDIFEMVAGVLVYEALSSRWTGSDLVGRVNRILHRQNAGKEAG